MIYTSQHLKQNRDCTGNTFKKRLQYQLKTGKLIKLRKGLYTDIDPRDHSTRDIYTIANSIYSPSYISLHTVLQQSGYIYQYSHHITISSPYTKEIVIQDQTYIYRRLPLDILTLQLGIYTHDTYNIATPERALCDLIYMSPYHPIDHIPTNIDLELIHQLIPYYSVHRGKTEFGTQVLHHIATLTG